MMSSGAKHRRSASESPHGPEKKVSRVTKEILINVFDEDSDVILLIRNEVQLRVATKVLSVASKPFSQIFGPKFLEGQSLNIEDPPTIHFPEDDPNSLNRLCYLLYHEKLELLPSESDCVQLVLLAEKYRCLHAIRTHTLVALRNLGRSTEEESDSVECSFHTRLLDTLIASYALKDYQEFRYHSRRFLLETTVGDCMTEALTRDGAHLVPPAVWSEPPLNNPPSKLMP